MALRSFQVYFVLLVAAVAIGSVALVGRASDARDRDGLLTPPADFAFVYEEEWGFKVDTFRGTVTKDLVSLPDTAVAMRFTKQELKRIYTKMVQFDVLAIRTPRPPYTGSGSGSSSQNIRLEVRAAGRTHRFAWESWRDSFSPEWKRLKGFAKYVRIYAQSREEYRRLPRSKGGYL